MWDLYRHRKGALYLGYQEVRHSESGAHLQSYRCLYENGDKLHWVRPMTMFFDEDASGPRFQHLGRIEITAPEDIQETLLFGYDAWGEGRDHESFFAGYAQCPNHIRGRRYALRLPDGALVAGINTLRFARDLSGIASVATAPEHRGKGYSRLILTAVSALLTDLEGVQRFLLFSEPDPSMYERQGYQVLPDEHQHFRPSVAMLRARTALRPQEACFLQTYF
jgi:GNAT superfamily N-acetyltransferase